MMYIENIFICISIPLFLSLIFIRGDMRKYMLFICIGMGMSVLSAYISSFFMGYYHTDAVVAAIEIVPVCEEVMKLLPLLFYLLIFEPERKGIPGAAVAIAVGFATFENVCYLTENGAADFDILLVRGISAGALHILCGILLGFGMAYIFCWGFLKVTGTIGLLGASSAFHAIFNLLVSADGIWKWIGYLFPSVMIVLLIIGWHLLIKMNKYSM